MSKKHHLYHKWRANITGQMYVREQHKW